MQQTDPVFAHLAPEWQHVIAVYLRSVTGISGSRTSYRSYHSVLKRFFRDNPHPGSVGKAEVLAFLQMPPEGKRSRDGAIAGATYNAKKSVLSGFYAFCSDYEINGKILYDKALPTRGLGHQKPSSAHYTLSVAQLEHFFTVVMGDGSIKNLRDYSLFAAYLFTTRRRGELVSLKWGDVSETTIVDPDGSTRPGYVFRCVMKGQQRSIHSQELPGPCYAAIKNYLQASGRLETIQPTSFVWVSTHLNQGRTGNNTNEVPLNSDYVGREFHRLCTLSGFPPEVSHLHILRHSAARIRYTQGQDIMSLRETLGHSSVSTTQKYVGNIQGIADPMARQLEKETFKFLSRK